MYETYQIKNFKALTLEAVENKANEWLYETCRQIDAIKSISVSSNEEVYFVSIVYLLVEDGPNA